MKISKKKCRVCGEDKILSDFQKNKNICKRCLSVYLRNLRSKRRLSGECIRCGENTPEKGGVHCKNCLSKRKVYEKKFLDRGVCPRCKENEIANGLETCMECNRRRKGLDYSLKKEVINYYGDKCAHCGENNLDFLCIDHINNDGAKHRNQFKSKKLGRHLYYWLKSNNYPRGFQVLCLNCNHKKELQQRVQQEVKHPEDRNRRQQIKHEVMFAYGNSCGHCGEKDIDKLTIDHIKGIKDESYQNIPSYGDKLYAWLKRNNFPPEFRTLCMNCNFIAGLQIRKRNQNEKS
jgi:hypothetical protein